MNLDRYDIVRDLAQGTCGKTSLAEDTGLPSRRLCVIKQLKPKLDDPKTYEIIKERFIVEARVLEKLGREIDQIPELYELVIQNDEIYLIQEWVEGKTLRDLVERNHVFQVTEVANILTSLLQILVKVYAKGVIHRDINPNNIIIRASDNLPVLIDFGLVKEVTTTITDSYGKPHGNSIVVGTKGYMAPEQASGTPVFASDLYSLGMTAVHLLTGKHPLELGDSSGIESHWRKYAPVVGDEFSAVIEKAIQPNYLHRYANPAEMLEAVRSCTKPVLGLQAGSLAKPEIYQGREDDATLIYEGDVVEQQLPGALVDKEKAQETASVTLLPLQPESDVELAVEVGNQILIYRRGSGVVVMEPSILAVNKLTGSIEAAGFDAENSMLLATNDLEIIQPVRSGKVSDRRLAGRLLKHFVSKACDDVPTARKRVVIAVPSGLTKVERQAFIDAAYVAEVAEVYLIESLVGAVVGVGMLGTETQGRMFIHLGETVTEILGVSGGRRLPIRSVNSGLDSMKEAIKHYLKVKYNLLIGSKTAQKLFAELGSAYPLEDELSLQVRGRNLIEGIPKTITVTDTEIREALEPVVLTIIDTVRLEIERTPTEISADIIEHGIVLTGNGARLKNLDKRIASETGVRVRSPVDPVTCVVLGAAKMLAERKLHLEAQSRGYDFIAGTAGFLQSPARAAMAVLGIFSQDLAIDMGSANVLVYAKGRGLVISEPSIMAINTETHQIEAFGPEAKEMLGRSRINLVPTRPVNNGAVADSEIAGKMLRYLIRKAHYGRKWASPRLILTVPSFLTKVEQEAFLQAAYHANASEVFLVDKTMAAAIGAGLPILEPSGNIIVDIGGETTEIAVISLSGVVYSRAIPVGGYHMDAEIISYIKRKYNLLIGQRTAEALKIEMGSAYPLEEPLSYEVRGRNLIEGIPKSINISDEEVREALADTIASIINSVRIALDRTPPELASDLWDRGLVLTGGGALLKNLDKRLSIETGLPVSVTDDPLLSVVLGAGKMLSDIDLLRQVSKELSTN
jgi:rod shape-determining protein MreB and related proteins